MPEMLSGRPDSAVKDAAGWIALSTVAGLGGESFRRLLAAFGGPEAVLQAGRHDLSGIVEPALAGRILQGPDRQAVEVALKWLEEPANDLVTLADEDYPRLLLNVPDPPPFLYLRGNRSLLGRQAIAIVGSRNATPQGIENARNFARVLSDAGLCIVSGLALGIDAAAHEGGLSGASGSIAVVGTGIDVSYPARNAGLARELEGRGLIVSEFALGTPPLGTNFPRRNRIISGLSLGCLVVEAGIRSGSLITARHALEQGREVFAIPGSIHSPLSKGCHTLIKQGAKLVECAHDILDELEWQATPIPAPRSRAQGAELTEGALLDSFGFDPVSIDALVKLSGLTSDAVCAMLLQLELAGRVASLPGGLYQRISRPG